MLKIVRYQLEHKDQWDQLVLSSKNGTFLFCRDYMDYHSGRFRDYSLLFYRKEKLEAVLPGNVDGDTFYSHQGLTYGGLVMSKKLRVTDVLKIFDLANQELKRSGIRRVVYKPVPYIYHKLPSQEDIYALFACKADKVACNLSSSLLQNNKIMFIESRKSGIRKSMRLGVKIEESNAYDLFWPILNENLRNKYSTSAVHDLSEIQYLSSMFPENIKLYLAMRDGSVLAGTVLYVMDNVVHVQYISASEEGKSAGALDVLFDTLINKIYVSRDVFDFGRSTEHEGRYLNENLIFQKEGFGGRGVVYETYSYLF